MTFSAIDLLIFIFYLLVIIGLGLWVSREKKGHQKEASDYFLASKSLPWWAVGASLIASNISAEQIIGMSGSGFRIGLAIASYEWLAAVTLILVAKYFLPIYLKKGIFTMPQFLALRYNDKVRTGLAIFWLFVYIFVNLTSVLYLGALSIKTILGVPLLVGILGLAIFSALYSIYGGLKAVAWTDVIQVLVLVGGGFLTVFLAIKAFHPDGSFFRGLLELTRQVPEKFDMILARDHPSYMDLPGLSVLLGAMWIAHFFYWGCNQYITQRALAARNLNEARRGLVFAAYLKVILPLIVVIPGIVAFALQAPITKADEAYPWLLSAFVPTGVKGIAFAALIAAIASSLSSMINSTATIFSIDIYRTWIDRKASDVQLVKIGRISALVALGIAITTAPTLQSLDQVFQYIQEFTGFVSPGILVIFIWGLFWKKASTRAAIWVSIITLPMAFLLKFGWESLPFLDRMGVMFVFLSILMVIVSLRDNRNKLDENAIEIEKGLFHTDRYFNITALGVIIILTMLYIRFW